MVIFGLLLVAGSSGILQPVCYSGVKQFTDYEDRFQYFLMPAFVLLLIEVMLSEKKVGWLARWNPLKREEGKANE